MGVIVLLFCCFFNTSTLNIMKPENVYARATDGYDNRTTGGHSIAESNNDNGVETNADDCSILGKDFNDLLKDIFLWIEISVPCITLLLCLILFYLYLLYMYKIDLKEHFDLHKMLKL